MSGSSQPFANESPTAPGASLDQIEWAERALGVSLPDDYRAFLAWSNGWEGWIGESYLQLVPCGELVAANDDDFRLGNPGLIAIGGDGGLETFALDYRTGDTPSGLIALDRNAGTASIQEIAASFSEGVARLAREPDGPWGLPN